jgi:hypothetical protein
VAEAINIHSYSEINIVKIYKTKYIEVGALV